jgi:hypothetical protein
VLGCRPTSPTAASAPLSFYIVSGEKFEGGRFIDSPDFPKLGFVAAAPDLAITQLEAVVPDVSRHQDVMVDKEGRQTVMPVQAKAALAIRMRADDAKKFTTLTERAMGKQILIVIGETPLMAPMIVSPISTQSLTLTFGEKSDQKKIEDELKKLVR